MNVLYYHGLSLGNIEVDVLNRKILDALKPGGAYFYCRPQRRARFRHAGHERRNRIDPEASKRAALAAGFRLAIESDLQVHSEDDHSAMAFSLGTHGATDRAVLNFVKP